jgi:pseudouridine synthase
MQQEEFIKYWKPVGVTSTTDRNIPGNLLDALEDSQDDQDDITQRIFSVGRLDKDSSGILLLTSDGRLPNAVLRKEFKRPKIYRITVNKPLKQQDIQLLRRGLVITTDTVRQGRHQRFRAPTLPCRVKVVGEDQRELEMELTEGRNRQIRVMLKTLGYSVTALHRTHFLGIDLSRLRGPGDWTRLNDRERAVLDNAMSLAIEKESQ